MYAVRHFSFPLRIGPFCNPGGLFLPCGVDFSGCKWYIPPFSGKNMEKMSRKCLAVSVEVRTFALAFAPKRGRGHRSLEDLHNNRKYKSTGISKMVPGYE